MFQDTGTCQKASICLMLRGPHWMLCPQWRTSLNYCGSTEKAVQQGRLGTWLWCQAAPQVAGASVLLTLLPPPHCQTEWARGWLPRKEGAGRNNGGTWCNPIPPYLPNRSESPGSSKRDPEKIAVLLTKLMTAEDWLQHSRDLGSKLATYL